MNDSLSAPTRRRSIETAAAAASRVQPLRVLILGGDSDYNLGDRAILTALCHCLAAISPRPAELTITSTIPEAAAWRELPGVVRTLPRGARALPALLRCAAKQDLVLIGGGGLFQDDDSRVKMPYWLARIAALRAVNPRIIAHSIGAGPLRHPESRLSARLVCNALESISVRDEFARDALAGYASEPIEVVPDPAFMLPPAERGEAERLLIELGLGSETPIIGVALRRWFHRLGGFIPHKVRSRLSRPWGKQDQAGYEAMDQLLDQLAVTLRGLATELGASILLLPTYNVQHEGDSAITRRLADRLDGLPVYSAAIDDPRLYKAVAGRLRLMLSARMHPLILASSMGVPIVGLAYNTKFSGLFRALGLPERILWLDRFRGSDLSAELLALAHEALDDPTDLEKRSQDLASVGRRRLEALVNAAA